MRSPTLTREGCCHAPSHIPGRKPLQTSRPDRWTRASLVNRSGRRNSFGHLVDGLRLRLRGIVDPLADGMQCHVETLRCVRDIFDLQDQVTMSVVGALTPQLERAEMARALRK